MYDLTEGLYALAATSSGVYYRTGTPTWTEHALTAVPDVRALAIQGEADVIVGGVTGVFLRVGGDPYGFGQYHRVQALHVADGSLWVGTADGLFLDGSPTSESANNQTKRVTGSHPLDRSDGLPNRDIRAITTHPFDPEQVVVAAAPGDYLDEDWPGFEPVAGQDYVDLDKIYRAPGTLALLVNGDHTAAARITRAEIVHRAAFTLAKQVTRLHLSPVPDLSPFLGAHLRHTEVWIGARLHDLFTPGEPLAQPVTGTVLRVEGVFPPFEAGRALVVCDAAGGEVVFALGSEADDQGHTLIELQPPGLIRRYDPAHMTIYGNVSLATHGQTVADEILGDGDPRQPSQRFALAKGPLTVLPAATENGQQACLEVRVDGVCWCDVPTLADSGPHDRVYTLEYDHAGRAFVVFGDGQHGARLPGGTHNVTATYRVGLGEAGNVRAGSVTNLLHRPLGVQRVMNPLPGEGGTDAEPLERVRRTIPASVQALGRVVALADIEAVALALPGVGAAEAVLFPTDHGRFVQLTVADARGDPVPPGSLLYTALRDMLKPFHDPTLPIRIQSAARPADHRDKET